jgi:hypothetical protein
MTESPVRASRPTRSAGARRRRCYNADSVAAIEQAPSWTVDVINYPSAGTNNNWSTRWKQHSAMPSRQPATAVMQTVAHPSRWITTVAAGTHDRSMTSTLTQGNAAVFAGASMALAGIRWDAHGPSSSAVGGKDPSTSATRRRTLGKV